jgi:hypothetical protein
MRRSIRCKSSVIRMRRFPELKTAFLIDINVFRANPAFDAI